PKDVLHFGNGAQVILPAAQVILPAGASHLVSRASHSSFKRRSFLDHRATPKMACAEGVGASQITGSMLWPSNTVPRFFNVSRPHEPNERKRGSFPSVRVAPGMDEGGPAQAASRAARQHFFRSMFP